MYKNSQTQVSHNQIKGFVDLWELFQVMVLSVFFTKLTAQSQHLIKYMIKKKPSVDYEFNYM